MLEYIKNYIIQLYVFLLFTFYFVKQPQSLLSFFITTAVSSLIVLSIIYGLRKLAADGDAVNPDTFT